MAQTATFDLQATVHSAQAGSHAAFGALVSQYKNLVFSIAYGVLRDVEAARDVTQNVFLAAWQQLAALRQPTSVPPWLRQTARRQALFHLRSTIRERNRREQQPLVPADTAPADVQLVAHEQARALEVALDQLPSDVREVLLLYYSEAQSIAQVASLMELSEDAVKKRLQRGRASLRAELEQTLGATMARVVPGAAFVAAIVANLGDASAASSAAAPKPRGLRWAHRAALLTSAAALVVMLFSWTQCGAHSSRDSSLSSAAAPIAAAHAPAPAAKPSTPSAPSPVPKPNPAAAPATPTTRPNAVNGPTPSCSFRWEPVHRRALSLSPAQLAQARVDVRANAMDPALHFLLAAYAAFNGEDAELVAEWKTHVAWLIGNCSSSTLFDSMVHVGPVAISAGVDSSLGALWLAETRKRPRDVLLALHAAEYFMVIDQPKQAETLLNGAIAIEPSNARLLQALGRLHALASRRSANAGHTDSAQNAVGYLEQALAAAKTPEQRSQLLQQVARAAFTSGDDGLANQRARELLALAPELGWNRTDAVHHGNIVLGQLALRDGKDADASRLLLASVDVAGSSTLAILEPDRALAQSLLARGHRDVVLRYLMRVKHLFHDDCIDAWIATLAAGGTPDLSRIHNCTAP